MPCVMYSKYSGLFYEHRLTKPELGSAIDIHIKQRDRFTHTCDISLTTVEISKTQAMRGAKQGSSGKSHARLN